MAQVSWSPTALNDLYLIAEYISQDSPSQAALFIVRLKEAVLRLGDFPRSGRHVAGISDASLREIVFGDYRIVYRVTDSDVRIETVIHGARDWPP
jgi:toxin ParE1/3/4